MNEPNNTSAQATPVSPEATITKWQGVEAFLIATGQKLTAAMKIRNFIIVLSGLLLMALLNHTIAGFALFEGEDSKHVATWLGFVFESLILALTIVAGMHFKKNPDAGFKVRWLQNPAAWGLLLTAFPSIVLNTNHAVHYGRDYNTLFIGAEWVKVNNAIWVMVIICVAVTLPILNIILAWLLGTLESEAPPQPLVNSLQATLESLRATIEQQGATIEQQGATIEQQGATIEQLTSGLGVATLDIQVIKDTLIIKCKHCGKPGTQNQINGHIWHCTKNPNKKTKKPAKALNRQ